MKKYCLFIFVLLLTSCGTSTVTDNNIGETKDAVQTAGSGNILVGTGNETDVEAPKKVVILMATGSQPPVSEGKLQGLSSVEIIQRISTLDELRAVNPFIVSYSGTNVSGFIELQKDLILLGIHMRQIQDPESLKIREELNSIYQGKEIWTTEFKKIDTEFTSAISQKNQSSTGGIQELAAIVKRRNDAMKMFQSSGEYKNYIKKSTSTIKDLNEALKKYWTPEIIQLQKDIQKLNTEI